MKQFLTFGFIAFCTLGAFAQTENSLFFLDNVYQSSHYNAAHLPNYRVSLTLPGLGGANVGVVNNGFNVNGVSRFERDTLFIEGDRFVSNLKKNNLIALNFGYDLFALRFRVRRTFFSLHVGDRFTMRFNYPKELMQLLWYGNSQYLGQTLTLDNFGVSSTLYREYAAGIAHETKKFNFGGRIKLLQGFAAVNTSTSKSSLFTSTGLDQIEVNSNLRVNTAGYDEDYFNTITENKIREINTDFSNKGLAVDAAATYKFSDRLHFSAGFNNLGAIRWSRFTKNYDFGGTVDFRGVELNKLISDSAVNFENFIDSLAERFELNESTGNFTTRLVANYFVSAKYELGQYSSLGAAVFMEYFYGLRPATTLAFHQSVNRWFEAVLTWSTQHRQYDMFGLALMVKPGPFQIYIAGDHFAALLNPKQARSFNFRFGINLIFGRIRQPDRLPTPDSQ